MNRAQNTPTSPMGVAVIGCGLIGKKRTAALARGQVKIACDLNGSLAESLAKMAGPGCETTSDAEAAVSRSDVDWVIVATTNQALSQVTELAIRAGKHVLVEKPGALKASELRRLDALAREKGVLVRVGFNHRFHRALLKAREILDSGTTGPLMFIRGRYGHGGRVGYDREWRANPALSGGGELIDQGVHLIDLAGWFMRDLGDFTQVEGHAATYFWDMPVDDNAFISLRAASGQTAWLQVSCTEWKNLFSLEIYCRDAKLHIEGLGGSYGVERLAHYKMLLEMGPPETTIYEYPQGDNSWAVEMQTFEEDIRLGREPSPGLRESARWLEIVETIYQNSGYPKGGNK
jgi:predicted dehydrogenase